MTRQNAEHGGEDRRVLMTQPHDGHGPDEVCPGCPDHTRVAPSAPTHADEGGA